MSLRGQVADADPRSCEEFGYGLGDPSGILVMRYRALGPMGFGDVRQDLVHQLYWSPDGMLSAVHGSRSCFAGLREGFWVERAVSHRVAAADRQTVYRICLRELPPLLADLRVGHVTVGDEAARLIQEIATPGYDRAAALRARRRILDDLVPAPDDISASCPDGRGFARAVARAMSHDPADPTRLDEWAARLHISPKTLQRDFVREFGVPFTRWRTRLRLHAARVLLGTDSVTAVAHRVGYASASAFVAAFAKEFGTPPGQFARELN